MFHPWGHASWKSSEAQELIAYAKDDCFPPSSLPGWANFKGVWKLSDDPNMWQWKCRWRSKWNCDDLNWTLVIWLSSTFLSSYISFSTQLLFQNVVSQGCLDALRVTNGATHTEVMMTEDGPCLVEVNSRCHGANGAWMPLVQALLLGEAAFMDEEWDGCRVHVFHLVILEGDVNQCQWSQMQKGRDIDSKRVVFILCASLHVFTGLPGVAPGLNGGEP